MNDDEIIKLILRSQKMAFLLGLAVSYLESEEELIEMQGIHKAQSFKDGVQQIRDGISDLFYGFEKDNE